MIDLYSKEDCIGCLATKTVLEARGVAYNELDITEPGNLAKVRAWGYQQAPVVDTGVETWSGFQLEKLEKLNSN